MYVDVKEGAPSALSCIAHCTRVGGPLKTHEVERMMAVYEETRSLRGVEDDAT